MRLADGRPVCGWRTWPWRWVEEDHERVDYPPHNHVTRANKRPGICPACDQYYWRVICREHEDAAIRDEVGENS